MARGNAPRGPGRPGPFHSRLHRVQSLTTLINSFQLGAVMSLDVSRRELLAAAAALGIGSTTFQRSDCRGRGRSAERSSRSPPRW